MPSYSLKLLMMRTPTRIAEVNPRRETLTIFNPSPTMLALADDDQPLIALNDIHGIPVYPYSSITLERESGDEPDKAWYLYSSMLSMMVGVFEGVTPLKKRWW